MNRRVELVSTRELKVVEREIPAAPPQGLVVKTHYAGICHSDMHFWENKVQLTDELVTACEDSMKKKFPWVIGHEISGEVYDIGSESCQGAPEVKKGDKVIVYPWIPGCDNTCEACLHGNQSSCSTRETNKAFIGCQYDGGWETYVAVPKRSMIVKVPEGISMDVACLVPCSGITAYNAIERAREHVQHVLKTCGNSTLLIHGVGGVGLWAVSVAKAVLPSTVKILAADIAPAKLAAAKQAGADDTVLIDPKASNVEVITSIRTAGGGGIDTILDFVGLGAAAGRLTQCLHKGGLLVLVGLAGGTLPLSAVGTVTTRMTVAGSLVGDRAHVEEMFKLLSLNKVHPPPIEHCKPEAETVNDALVRMEERKLDGRVIIQMV